MFCKILILMFVCHVLDDFVLQPICLSKLKQQQWWKMCCSDPKYKNDYKMALTIHSLSWSAMILLPIMFLMETYGLSLFCVWIINAVIHYIVDDLKSNVKKINLITDQTLHFCQILLTLGLFFFILA